MNENGKFFLETMDAVFCGLKSEGTIQLLASMEHLQILCDVIKLISAKIYICICFQHLGESFS